MRLSATNVQFILFSFALFVIAFSTSDVAAAGHVRPPEYPAISSGEAASNASIWFSVSLAVLSIALLVSVAISFDLYRWRRILLSNPHMLAPEELGERLLSYEKSLNQLHNSYVEGTNKLGYHSNTVSSKLQEMIETFMILQNSIDEKDAEIKRYKSGYDLTIFKRYLFRFVRIHQTMVDIDAQDTFSKDDLALLKRLVEDAMDECGVEEFAPDLGVDVREVEGVADNPKKILAEDGQSDFEIVEVRETGYRCLTKADQYEIIIPSKVTIAFTDHGG